MGNGLPRTPLDWRIVKHEVSYKQFLRDVKFANQLCSHSFVDDNTGRFLRFDCVTNVDRHELLPLLWRLEGKLLVIARSEKVAPVQGGGEEGQPHLQRDGMGEEEEVKGDGGDGGEEEEIRDVSRALTVHQFYRLFIYLTDNSPLLQQAKAQLHKITHPNHLPAPPPLVISSGETAGKEEEDEAEEAAEVEDDSRMCSICMSSSVEVALPCLHAFCKDCIAAWYERDATCPLCRSVLDGMTGDEIWVMDSGSEKELREQISAVSHFPHKFLEDKPAFVA